MSGDAFAPEVLRMTGELTERAWLLPFVRRVNSLTNFQHTYAEGDEMIVRDLVPDIEAVDAAAGNEAREIALSRPEIVHSLISPDGKHAALQVLFRLPGTDVFTEVPSVVAETEVLMEEIRAANPDIRFGVTGFRSVLAVLMTVLVIAVSAITGLGALGWSGVALNSVTVLAPLIIMTLAVASVVHVLASVRQTMMETEDRKEWARRALHEHGGEIAIACLTTAIGFLALNFSISPPFRELGNVVAVGVVAAMVLTLTFLPALVTFLPMKRREKIASVDGIMSPLAEFVIRWRKVLLVVMSLFVLLLASGVPKLVLEDDFIKYFDERYEFRVDSDYYEDNLGGLNVIEYALPAGRSDGINDPAFLASERLNMNMHADDPAMFKLPEEEQAVAQFLFLYELSLGYGMDLTDQINVDRSKLRITTAVVDVTTRGMLALDRPGSPKCLT